MTAGECVIRTESLTKRYGKRQALDGVDLEVRRGEIFGYIGPNGAGKSTTLRILIDLLRPTSGRVEVLGRDPRTAGAALRREIGYLPGDFRLDGRQTVRETLALLADLRGGVPAASIERLYHRLDLDPTRRVRDLSKGNRQKVGLVQAFMHTPPLLILDEPTSGLDPLVQSDFLEMVREARTAGQTVFMSSHMLSEVQHGADRVGIIRAGRVVAVDSLDALRQRAARRVEVRFAAPVDPRLFRGLPGVADVETEGDVLRCRLTGTADAFVKAIASHTVLTLRAEEPDLEEVFLGYYGREEPGHAA